jgi:hypothetical protein
LGRKAIASHAFFKISRTSLVESDEFHFTHFTFRLKGNDGKTTYLPALGDLYAGKKCRKEVD